MSVATGRGRVVLLDGEPGIGKTRLAREVLACAQRTGALTFVGRCFEQHEAAPFFPFMELLGSAFDAAPADVQSGARQRWPELVHLIPNMAHDEPEKLTAEYTQLRLFRATSSFISEQAEAKPLVMLLDDLHWADSTSLSLLLFLARYLDTAHVLILGTYRDTEVGRQQPLEATLRELVRERLVDEVHLRRMSADGTSALVSARLGAAAASDDLISFVHSRAQGNPFFTEELLAALVEQGVLSGGYPSSCEEPWRAGTAPQRPFPDRRAHQPTSASVARTPPAGEPAGRRIRARRLARRVRVDRRRSVGRSGRGSARRTSSSIRLATRSASLSPMRLSNKRFRRSYRSTAAVVCTSGLAKRWRTPGRARQRARLWRATSSWVEIPNGASSMRFALAMTRRRVTRMPKLRTTIESRWICCSNRLADSARAADVSYRLAGELYDLNKLSEALAAFEAAFVSYGRLNNQGGQALAQWGIARLHQGRYDMATADRHAAEALRLWPPDRQDADLVHLLVDAARIKAFGGFSGGADLADRSLDSRRTAW